jgi:hypothetical protein
MLFPKGLEGPPKKICEETGQRPPPTLQLRSMNSGVVMDDVSSMNSELENRTRGVRVLFARTPAQQCETAPILFPGVSSGLQSKTEHPDTTRRRIWFVLFREQISEDTETTTHTHGADSAGAAAAGPRAAAAARAACAARAALAALAARAAVAGERAGGADAAAGAAAGAPAAPGGEAASNEEDAALALRFGFHV